MLCAIIHNDGTRGDRNFKSIPDSISTLVEGLVMFGWGGWWNSRCRESSNVIEETDTRESSKVMQKKQSKLSVNDMLKNKNYETRQVDLIYSKLDELFLILCESLQMRQLSMNFVQAQILYNLQWS